METSYRLGVHVPGSHSANRQEELGADIVQITLGSPRKWRDARIPDGDLASPFYVHAPYLINLSSANPHVLKNSIECLREQSEMAAKLGAEGLVIHGGSWKKSHMDMAIIQWKNALKDPFPLPILIENAASGSHSLTRYAQHFQELWRDLGAATRDDIGWCLDTCHLWVSSEYPDGELEHMLSAMGSPTLVHANGAAAKAGSKLDRHSPWWSSIVPATTIGAWIKWAGCSDVIAETKDPEIDLRDMRRLLK